MKGFFRNVMVDRFWRNWRRRMDRSSDVYINPSHSEVIKEASNLNINPNLSDTEVGYRLWEYIRNTYEYELTNRWRRPEELISEGVGDCEDYCFLMSSLLPHFGVDEFKLVSGEAKTDGESEFHVWVVINGEVMDPTATRSQSRMINYEPELVFDIEV